MYIYIVHVVLTFFYLTYCPLSFSLFLLFSLCVPSPPPLLFSFSSPPFLSLSSYCLLFLSSFPSSFQIMALKLVMKSLILWVMRRMRKMPRYVGKMITLGWMRDASFVFIASIVLAMVSPAVMKGCLIEILESESMYLYKCTCTVHVLVIHKDCSPSPFLCPPSPIFYWLAFLIMVLL